MSRDASTHQPARERHHRPYSATRKQLVILGLFPLSEAIAWTTIFPYIYSMVQSFSSSESDDQNSAIYAGIMVSVFTFGEFIMAPQWANISDKIGRKPTLLIGSLGAMFSAILFGFSKSLPWAVTARIFAGLLNPNLGVVQTFVGELVGKEEQAKGFSVVPFLRSFGTIIGPVIGGYLAKPVEKYPWLFAEHTIWDRYPFLLPNIVVVVFLLSSCIIGLLYLEEVHPKFQGQNDFGSIIENVMSLVTKSRARKDSVARYSVVETDDPDIELSLTSSEIAGGSEALELVSQPPPAFSRQVMLQILSSAILGFLKIATLAMVPIFLATPQEPIDSSKVVLSARNSIWRIKGGFGLDTTSTSHVLLSQAIATIISQILAIPAIITKLGPLRGYRVALVFLAFFFSCMPLAAGLPRWAGLPAILITLWAYALANGLATTSSAILVTNTAPSPVHLAKINGACASLGCLARTLGPAISGPLFQLGLRIGHIGLPFWSLSGISGLGFIVAFSLRDYP